VIAVAQAHAANSKLAIDYEVTTAEDYADQYPARFDCVVCMELIEHVPDPNSLIRACARLTKPGGMLFLSTLNRTPQAYLHAIIGAEYLLKLLPIGTHDYLSFIRPAEMATMLRANEFDLREVRGMRYNPFSRRADIVAAPKVNYLAHAQRR